MILDAKVEMVPDSLHSRLGSTGEMRICNRCRRETNEMFCPDCKVLTSLPKERNEPVTSEVGEVFECTIWQAANRSRAIEIPIGERDRHFSRDFDMIVLYIDGLRTICKLGSGFWKRPAVIKKALGEDGKDKLAKFIEKHHLLPPDQSLKEKGVVDTIAFEVLVPAEEFKASVTEKVEANQDLS